MREMKDSGMPWIGKIPNTWDLTKIKFVCKARNEKGYYQKDKDKYLGLENVVGFSNTIIETESSYENGIYDIYKAGDVLFNKLRPYLGKVIISSDNGFCTGEFIRLYDFQGDIRFLRYWMIDQSFIDEVDNSTYGAKMPRANSNFILNLAIPRISYNEQNKIANYLDAKCADIDALQQDLQSEIEALKEYKKSVITEAVTKGLNKNVEMKDSGIPWCPRIPKHWVPTNPKALFHQRKERARENDKQLTASQKHGIVFQDDFMKIENQKVVTVAKDFDILKHVEPNDFVISMRSFQGGLEFSELSGCISSAYVMLVPNCNLVYPPFYRWLFKSDKYINAIQSTTNLIRDGQAMRFANFVMVPLFIIPLDEQQRIADYLNKKCSKIDSIIQKKQELLANLDTYKKSLIYEYVTGKKEVPAV